MKSPLCEFKPYEFGFGALYTPLLRVCTYAYRIKPCASFWSVRLVQQLPEEIATCNQARPSEKNTSRRKTATALGQSVRILIIELLSSKSNGASSRQSLLEHPSATEFSTQSNTLIKKQTDSTQRLNDISIP